MEIKITDKEGHEKVDRFIRAAPFEHAFAEASARMRKHEIIKINASYNGFVFSLSAGDGHITLNGTVPKELIPMTGHGSITLSDSGVMAVDFEVPEAWLYGKKD